MNMPQVSRVGAGNCKRIATQHKVDVAAEPEQLALVIKGPWTAVEKAKVNTNALVCFCIPLQINSSCGRLALAFKLLF